MRRPTKRQVLYLLVAAEVLAVAVLTGDMIGQYRAQSAMASAAVAPERTAQSAESADSATLRACLAAKRLDAETGDWHTPTQVLAHFSDYVMDFNAPRVDPEFQASINAYIYAYDEAMAWQGVDAWGDPEPEPMPAEGVTAPDEPRPQPTPAALTPAEQEKMRAQLAEDVEHAIAHGREATARGNAVCVAASNRLHHK